MGGAIDPELGNFKCKSVQKPTMSGDFPDTEGGNKCGRLSPQEEEKLSDDVQLSYNHVLWCVIKCCIVLSQAILSR